ncbi:MAG: hypothetical protein EB036_09765, partial [Betaproteobacteria bacterium]|nr:hypothetical protein [Betaproteobacteria bacterium]
MRIVIAQLKHETNTFSPVPTDLSRFSRIGDQPPCGADAVKEYRHTGSAIAAMIDLAEQAGADYTVAVAGNAPPSGPVQDAAYEWMVSRICDAVKAGCDAVLLDLHGAMVTERYDDGEGELLRRLRAIAPHIPIAVALDMHTNLSNTMVSNADLLAGYQTYPHVDVYETGLRAAKPVIDWLVSKRSGQQAAVHGGGQPIAYKAWGQVPMLPHVMRQSSLDSPNREIQARCKAIEAEGALAASVFVGFPHADIPIAGMSALVIDPSDQARADRWRDELLAMCWEARASFVYQIEPLDEAISRAKQLAQHAAEGKPVVLLDHYDNCASGGTMDTTAVLAAMIRADLQQAAAFAIFDPEAVQKLMTIGIGAETSLQLGGKLDLRSLKPKFGSMAFYINYPNTYDQMAGRTGYDIMLHSTDVPERLKQNYDSEGCIVLENDEIRQVKPYVRLGLTPILVFPELSPEFLKPGQDTKLKAFFESWITDWESKDINRYIEHYHSDFSAQGKNKAQWKAYKSGLNSRYSSIKIGPEDVRYYQHPK